MSIAPLDSETDRRARSAEYRYPGPHSFEDSPESSCRFFGRDADIQQLMLKTLNCPLVTLYSISGLGKTSLLKAGVFPALRKQKRFPVLIRFPSEAVDPQAEILKAIERECWRQRFDQPTGNRRTLWEFFKTAVFCPSRRAELHSPVLVLDQFEEAFTLHDAKFRKSLAEIIASLSENRAPKIVREEQENYFREDEHYEGYSPAKPNVRLIISLREDFLGSLEEFVPWCPQILAQRFRLTALTPESARKAIVEPAKVNEPGFFDSAPFEFDPPAVDRILQVATAHEGAVEPFVLQLLCNFAEQQILAEQKKSPPDAKLTVTVDMLGADWTASFQEHYSQAVRRAAFCNAGTENKLRNWFEEELISQDRNSRRPFLVDQAESYGISATSLQELDRALLIRRSTLGSAKYYELTHERLIEPILENNKKWRDENQHEIQRRSRFYYENHERDDLLLDRHGLEIADHWMKEVGEQGVTNQEGEYIELSRELYQKQRERFFYQTSLVSIAVGVLVGWLLLSNWNEQTARRNEEKAVWYRDSGLMSRALLAWNADDPQSAFDWLETRTQKGKLGWETHYLHHSYFDRGVLDPPPLPAEQSGYSLALDAKRNLIYIGCLDSGKLFQTSLESAQGNSPKPHVHNASELKSPVSIALSSAGDEMVSADFSGRLIHWNLKQNPIEHKILKESDARVKGIAIRPDQGESLVFTSFSADNEITLWTRDSQGEFVARSLHQFEKDDRQIACMAWSTDGNQCAFGFNTGDVEEYLATEKEGLDELPTKNRRRHASGVWSLAYNEQYLASADADGMIKVVKRNNNEAKAIVLKGHRGQTFGITFSGDTLYSCGEDRTIRRWEVAKSSDESLSSERPHRFGRSVSCVALHPKSPFLIAGLHESKDDPPCIQAVELARSQSGLTLSSPHPERPYAIAFSPDGSQLASASGRWKDGEWQEGELKIWTWSWPFDDQQRPKPVKVGDSVIYALAWSPKGDVIFCGHAYHGAISAIDVATSKSISVAKTKPPSKVDPAAQTANDLLSKSTRDENSFGDRILSLAFAPSRGQLISGHGNGIVRVWNVTFQPAVSITWAADIPIDKIDPKSPDELDQIKVDSLAISPDERLVLAGRRDGQISVINLQTQSASPILAGHSAAVNTLHWMRPVRPDDVARIVSGSDDKMLRFWDSNFALQLELEKESRPERTAEEVRTQKKYQRPYDASVFAIKDLEGPIIYSAAGSDNELISVTDSGEVYLHRATPPSRK